MSHHITGLVARQDVFARLESDFSSEGRFELAQGLAFLPLDGENLDRIVGAEGGAAIGDFVFLTERLVEHLKAQSRAGALLYIETEYFGGTGGQGAALFQNQALAFGPEFGAGGAINRGLMLLGVKRGASRDAFETAGLQIFRSNDDFRSKGRRV
jgi:hypothetical protein